MTNEDSSTVVEQKEEHRLGTIGRWDPPEADWAAEFDWTRYRGPDAYPVPGAWVLSIVEGDGIIWYRYPEVGVGKDSDTDVHEEVEDDDTYNDLRDAMASLGNTIIDEDRQSREVTLEQKLTIEGETVFRRVAPDTDELYANVAAALKAYDDNPETDEYEISWQTGRLPEDIREKQDLERRKEQNNSLGDFA
jgi:hypothetical protein